MANYPNLRGDLDADPRLLTRLNWLAKMSGQTFNVTSGKRSRAEQAALYANRGSNPYPVAKPGSSRHESGLAADVLVNGKPIQQAYSASKLRRAGLSPLAGDAVHVELAGAKGISGQLADAGGALKDLPGGVKDAIPGPGDVAGATARAIVKLLVKALGDDAVRLALYPAFLGAGLTIAGLGVVRMLGGKPTQSFGALPLSDAALGTDNTSKAADALTLAVPEARAAKAATAGGKAKGAGRAAKSAAAKPKVAA